MARSHGKPEIHDSNDNRGQNPTAVTAAHDRLDRISDANGLVTMLVDDHRYLAVVPAAEVESREPCRMPDQLGNGQPLVDWLLGRPYQSPNLACWRLTDQADERSPIGSAGR